jgi:hypothetical protein
MRTQCCGPPTFWDKLTTPPGVMTPGKDRAAVDEWFTKVNKDYLLKDEDAGGSVAGVKWIGHTFSHPAK